MQGKQQRRLADTIRLYTDGKPKSGERKIRERRLTGWICILAAVLLAFAVCRGWKVYYDLNDDSLMAEILAGSYTGTPAFRNIQSYYPLTLVLGGLYRLTKAVDWYGLFLLAVQYGCLALVWNRIARAASQQISGRKSEGSRQQKELHYRGALQEKDLRDLRNAKLQAAGGIALTLLTAGSFLLYHYVYLQYSVTVGILGATACVLFLTMNEIRLREVLPPVLLIWLGYLLRSEMMLFVGPLVALAFLLRLCELTLLDRMSGETESVARASRETINGTESERISKRWMRSGNSGKGGFAQGLLLVGCLVLLGLGLGTLGQKLGYRSAEWKTFQELFDARTDLYDFASIPDYEGNEAFYESIGLQREQVTLLQNYNYGLDDSIDAGVLQAVADYAKAQYADKYSLGTRIKNALWDYRASLTTNAEEPYRTIILALYGLVLVRIAAALLIGWKRKRALPGNNGEAVREEKKEKRCLLLHLAGLVLLFAGRSVLLLYLYYNHRPVTRLTHSVFLCEAVILLWMLTEKRCAGNYPEDDGKAAAALSEKPANETAEVLQTKAKPVTAEAPGNAWTVLQWAAVVIVMTWGLMHQLQLVNEEQESRTQKNAAYQELQTYAEEHAENVYLVDVYSTVDFSDRLGEPAAVPVNLDLLGGWACKSPLEREKLRVLGLDVDTTMESGTGAAANLLEQDNVYVAAESGEDMDWLAEYYAAMGTNVQVKAVDQISENWVIYAVTKLSD